ncbi:15-cis-phytoene desaturase [Glycomyces halotolerans]
MTEVETLVIGGGLAGLSCGFELADAGREVMVLESRPVVGGRASSWSERGMPVESGLHRVLGCHPALPRLLERAGVGLDRFVHWEDELQIRAPDSVEAVLGASPLHRPLRTLLGPFANWRLLSPPDLLSLAPFLAAGLSSYVTAPERLDRYTLSRYARRWSVTQRAQRHVLTPFSTGLFFLPPDRYSAANFFGLIASAFPAVHRTRLGAFTGGMTEVMCDPIAEAIEARGGLVRTGAPADRLLGTDEAVAGAETDEETIRARNVVVATDLGAAQRLLRPALAGHPGFTAILAAPTTPAVTVQFELDRPCLRVDRATFGPGTALACFSEQSRTTFRHADGRLSVILGSPDRFLGLPEDEIVAKVRAGADRLGLPLDGIRRHRVVSFREDFLSLEPGHLAARPPQRTPVPGLFLAGDYTRQRYLSSMEGAVVSGRRAAHLAAEDRPR